MSAGTEPDNVVSKTLARLSNSLSVRRKVEEETTTTSIGWKEHHEAVELLMFSIDNIAEDHQVRLDKQDSNLLRMRTATPEDSTAETENMVLLDPENLNRVISIDAQNATVDVQGMCTYEDLVDATLAFGLVPMVVPSLKNITVGGALAGSTTESSSFRNGLPQASVLEMDIITGKGEVLTCSATENTDLFRAFPNSYGTLGYAVRVKLELEPVLDYVELQHVRFDELAALVTELKELTASGTFDGQKIDYLEGMVFSATESYLVIGIQTAEPGEVSDYTQENTYYHSIRHRSGTTQDRLKIRDYLWRWDTDWFWDSRETGVQNPNVRKIWPPELLRGSFYARLRQLDQKFNLAERPEGEVEKPTEERMEQTVEIPADSLLDFLGWVLDTAELDPVWLCPLQLLEKCDAASTESIARVFPYAPAGERRWLLSPLTPHTTWVDVGMWGNMPADLLGAEAPGKAFSQAVEKKATDLGGHTLLYSDTFYTREEFAALYSGEELGALKEKFDPKNRFPDLYDKVVNGN